MRAGTKAVIAAFISVVAIRRRPRNPANWRKTNPSGRARYRLWSLNQRGHDSLRQITFQRRRVWRAVFPPWDREEERRRRGEGRKARETATTAAKYRDAYFYMPLILVASTATCLFKNKLYTLRSIAISKRETRHIILSFAKHNFSYNLYKRNDRASRRYLRSDIHIFSIQFSNCACISREQIAISRKMMAFRMILNQRLQVEFFIYCFIYIIIHIIIAFGWLTYYLWHILLNIIYFQAYMICNIYLINNNKINYTNI